MEAPEFWTAYPRLYHMAEDGSWPLIRKFGLLSTNALLERFAATPEVVSSATDAIRTRMIEVVAPGGDRAFIRDQLPLRLRPLEGCLVGVTVSEWLATLNAHVFFWVREERLLRLLNAKAYRNARHTVIVARSEALLRRHGADTRLTTLNTGSTLFNPRPRGVGTFRTVEDFDYEGRRRVAGRDAVVELAVLGSVSVDEELIESVFIYDGGTRVATLFSTA